MAAKKRSSSEDSITSAESILAAMLDKQAAGMNRDDIYIGTEAEKFMIGLRLPALSLRFLLCWNVWLFGRLTRLTGAKYSCKTAFLNEIARWHLQANGLYFLAENESKDAPILRRSIIQDPKLMQRVVTKFSRSMEDWQQFVTSVILNYDKLYGSVGQSSVAKKAKSMRDMTPAQKEAYKEQLQIEAAERKKASQKKITTPMLCGVDSFTATGTEEDNEKVFDEGFAGRGFAIEALNFSKYLKAVPPLMRKYPISLVGTNHVKPVMNKVTGMAQRNVPGGKSPEYMQTFDIELSKISDIHKAEYDGVLVKMSCEKNSAGAGDRFIQVPFVWWVDRDEETGKPVQTSMFDWHTSSIDLLLRFKKAGKNSKPWKDIAPIVNIQEGKAGRVYSTELGVPDSEAMSKNELGAILNSREDILEALGTPLHILSGKIYEGTEDYREAMDSIIAEASIKDKKHGPQRQTDADEAVPRSRRRRTSDA